MMLDVSEKFFVLQQGSVPAHRANATLPDFWKRATPAFIPSNMWPLYSPDINPVDYNIWVTVQQRVYHTRVHNVKEQRCLHGIKQNIIESATNELCGWFKAFVQPKVDISNNCSENINNPFNHL